MTDAGTPVYTYIRKGDNRWVVDVPSIDLHTDAYNLHEVHLLARTLIANDLGIPLEDVKIHVHYAHRKAHR